MSVNSSPRMRDSLDYEDPETVDPRLSFGFRSMSLDSLPWSELNDPDDHRPFSGSPDPSSSRKKKRQRNSQAYFNKLKPFRYPTVADGDVFRLVVVHPGTGTEPITCRLLLDDAKKPKYEYMCLSYCWETTVRDERIVLDGFSFPVTKNLLNALRNLRKPTTNLLIWADQLSINQDDDDERGHQVSIMKRIFNQAKDVYVWLGEDDDKVKVNKLFEYAKRMRRTDGNPKSKNTLDKILTPRQFQQAIQRLLERPWFQRVWVIPEVALARFTVVACGRSHISWDNLVRMIRDCQAPPAVGFDKQVDLLGNARQRIAIITQMIASQREGLAHTDITQLLILAKSSKATDVRDMIYAFYGLTLLTTFPNYKRSVEVLYTEIVEMYINSIKWEMSYSRWHDLTDTQRTQQLMSILYSAGSLHQHCALPSWVPDWSFNWHLAPIWCKTSLNIVLGSGKDEWSSRIRCDFRAGGETHETFEIIDEAHNSHQLLLSVIVFDSITVVSETTPASTPGLGENSRQTADTIGSHTLRYGRTYFNTAKGHVGIATPGVEAGDDLAVVIGGDVPVVLRPCRQQIDERKWYKLLCECYVENDAIMQGELLRNNATGTEDVVLI